MKLLTPILYKILVHGPAKIKHALLAIEQLSEEAAEARNKHIRCRHDFSSFFSQNIKTSESCLPETIELFLEQNPQEISDL